MAVDGHPPVLDQQLGRPLDQLGRLLGLRRPGEMHPGTGHEAVEERLVVLWEFQVQDQAALAMKASGKTRRLVGGDDDQGELACDLDRLVLPQGRNVTGPAP